MSTIILLTPRDSKIIKDYLVGQSYINNKYFTTYFPYATLTMYCRGRRPAGIKKVGLEMALPGRCFCAGLWWTRETSTSAVVGEGQTRWRSCKST